MRNLKESFTIKFIFNLKTKLDKVLKKYFCVSLWHLRIIIIIFQISKIKNEGCITFCKRVFISSYYDLMLAFVSVHLLFNTYYIISATHACTIHQIPYYPSYSYIDSSPSDFCSLLSLFSL